MAQLRNWFPRMRRPTDTETLEACIGGTTKSMLSVSRNETRAHTEPDVGLRHRVGDTRRGVRLEGVRRIVGTLSSRRSSVIGVVASSLRNSLFAEMSQGVADALGPAYDLMARQRRAGFIAALQSHRLKLDSRMILETESGIRSGAAPLLRLMDSGRPVNAVVPDQGCAADRCRARGSCAGLFYQARHRIMHPGSA